MDKKNNFIISEDKLKITINDLNNIIINQKKAIYNLLTVIKELPGSIYWKNKNGVYLGHNDFSKEEMQKLNLSDCIAGKTDFDLFPYDVANQYRQNDLEVMQSGKAFLKEEIMLLPNGKKVFQISHKKPLINEEGDVIGVMGNTTDVTYIKQTEEELLHAKEDIANTLNSLFHLLHNVEFCFKSSLREILLLINLLISTQDNHDYELLLIEIKDFIVIMLNDCNNILNFNFNTLNTTKIPSLRKKFKLRAIVNEVISKSNKFAKRRNLKLILNISENIPTLVIGDVYRIKKIIQLILSNVMRSSVNNSIIKLSIKLAEKLDTKIVIAIIFEGFKEFFQNVNEKTIKKNKYFKLGDPKLPIIELLIKELQGNLKLIKEDGILKNICTLELKTCH